MIETFSCVKSGSSLIFIFLYKLQIMPRDQSEIFKILPSYNSYIERPKIKKLSNVRLLKDYS